MRSRTILPLPGACALGLLTLAIGLSAVPMWEGWLEALAHNRVVAVRHDAATRYRTRMLGGAPGVQAFARDRVDDWKWWGDRPEDLCRPWASLVAVAPADSFETARPEKGVTLRVRLWWRGRGVLSEPVALTLNGERVLPEEVERRNDRGARVDYYHRYDLPAPASGEHIATATVRHVASGRLATETIRFTVPD